MVGSTNLEGCLPKTKRLTSPSKKGKATKSLFTTLTKAPQCNESRMIENILGDFKEVYRLVSREKDYSLVGIIPPKTRNRPISQKKKLQFHPPGSYLNKLQNSAIRLKNEDRGDYTMGPEESEFSADVPICDIKEVLEKMIVDITPITPLPSTPEVDRYPEQKYYKGNKHSILKDKTNFIKPNTKVVNTKTAPSNGRKPGDPQTILHTTNQTTSKFPIAKHDPNAAIITKPSQHTENTGTDSENNESDSKSSSSSSGSSSSSSSSSGSSESGSDSSSEENYIAVNQQKIPEAILPLPKIAKTVKSQSIRGPNCLVPVRSLSESSSDNEEISKTKQSNKNSTILNTQTSIRNCGTTNNTDNLYKSKTSATTQNENNNLIKINSMCNPNTILERSCLKPAFIQDSIKTESGKPFNSSQISLSTKQRIAQTKNGIKLQVENLHNTNTCLNGDPTYRRYPMRGVGKRVGSYHRMLGNSHNQTVVNSSLSSQTNLSNLNKSFKPNEMNKSMPFEAIIPSVNKTTAPNADKNMARQAEMFTSLQVPTKSKTNNNAEVITESSFKSSTLSGSSSSSSSSESSSSSNSSSSSDTSSSSNSSSSSDSEEEGTPTTSCAQSLTNSQSLNTPKDGNISTEVSNEKKKTTESISKPPNQKVYYNNKKEDSINKNICRNERVGQEIKSQNCSNIKPTISLATQKQNAELIHKILINKDINTQNIISRSTNISLPPTNSSHCDITKIPKPKPKNDTLKSSKNTTTSTPLKSSQNTSNGRKKIRSSKIKSREFVEDSPSSSDEEDLDKFSAARIRPYISGQSQRIKDLEGSFIVSDGTSTTSTVPDAGIVSNSGPGFVDETAAVSKLIPEKMTEQPSSSDADSENEPEDKNQKKCIRKFKMDRNKKQALPKVFGRILYKGNPPQNMHAKNDGPNLPTNKEVDFPKTGIATAVKTDDSKNCEEDRKLSTTSTSTSDPLNRTPIKLKIDLKRLRCVRTDNEADESNKQISGKTEIDQSVDCKLKNDVSDLTKNLKKTAPKNISKIQIKMHHHPKDRHYDKNSLNVHRQENHQNKSKDNLAQPMQTNKPNEDLKNNLKLSESNSPKSQQQFTTESVCKNPIQDCSLNIDKIQTKHSSDSAKRKRSKHEKKDKFDDSLFTPVYTKTKDNRYLPNISSKQKQNDKIIKRSELPKYTSKLGTNLSDEKGTSHTVNHLFKEPTIPVSTTLKSPSVNIEEKYHNSSVFKSSDRKHRRSSSYDRRDKEDRRSFSRNDANALSRSVSKDEDRSRSSSKDHARKHKRDTSDNSRDKHRKLPINTSANTIQILPSNDHGRKHNREKKHKGSSSNSHECNNEQSSYNDHGHNQKRPSSIDHNIKRERSSSNNREDKKSVSSVQNNYEKSPHKSHKNKVEKSFYHHNQKDKTARSPERKYQKTSFHDRERSSSQNNMHDREERSSSLKTSSHKSDKQEKSMSNSCDKSMFDQTVKDHQTESSGKGLNQLSLSNKIVDRNDHKTIKPEEKHSALISASDTQKIKPVPAFAAPERTLSLPKPVPDGNSHCAGGRISSDSSADNEKPIKRRKPPANSCAGKKVKISKEQGKSNNEPQKAETEAVSPTSSDWVCEDDDSDERPGELFANYAAFVQKIDEIETISREALIARGKELKHAADSDCYRMRQVLLYLDSCLHYIRATALPVPNDRTAASRLSLETLPLICFTRKRCDIEKCSEKNRDKFRVINILCLRCEAIIYNHLFKLKQHQCYEVMKEVEDFLDTGKGDLLRENTPPSSSPGREHPFLPSNKLLNTIQRQNAFLQYLTHSQMLWEKADKLTADFEGFFHELNVEYGEMSVYKPMTHVYNFTRGAIAKLLKP